MHGMSRRSTAARPARTGSTGHAWILLAALACLGGQGLSLAHLALVRHATCPEHDALVHTPAETPAAPALSPRGAAVRGLPTGELAHEDDHCLAVGLGRRQLLPATSDQGPRPALADRSPVPAFSDAAVPTPLPLLHLAPKSSPPPVTA